jgi:hypothetical protein
MSDNHNIEGFIEPASLLFLTSRLNVNKDEKILFLTLLFKKIYSPSIPKKEIIESNKYLKTSIEFYDEFSDVLKSKTSFDYSNIKEPFDQTTHIRVSIWLHSMLTICKEKGWFFIVIPYYHENFIDFCSKVEPSFIEKLKKSFLYYNIFDFVQREYFSNMNFPDFDEIIKIETLLKDFRNGLFQFTDQFKGSYTLNEEQKLFIKQKLSSEEQKILSLINLEKLRQISIKEFGSDLIDLVVSIASPVPIPVGMVIDFFKRVYEIQEFRKKNLDFAYSFFVLRRILNKKIPSTPILCLICSKTFDELKNLSNEEVEATIKSPMCIRHMVAYLNARKPYGLFGKDILLAIKKNE